MTTPSRKAWPIQKRVVVGSCLILIALLVAAFALNIPFTYPSSSILYKFGWDKTMLRSGKMVAITVIFLLSLQPFFLSRFTFMIRTFGSGSHFTFHRYNGFLLSCLILLHPILVRAPENFEPIPFTDKYWPEYFGIFLICFLILFATGALLRNKLGISYKVWRKLHAIAGFFLIFSALVHAHFVSTSFQSGPPRALLFVLAAAMILLAIRLRQKIFS